MQKPVLATGLYRHYKGQAYQVIDLARHSESEEWHVVYRPLYGDFGLWIRPYAMFVEEIEHQGQRVQRFAFESAEVPA